MTWVLESMWQTISLPLGQDGNLSCAPAWGRKEVVYDTTYCLSMGYLDCLCMDSQFHGAAILFLTMSGGKKWEES